MKRTMKQWMMAAVCMVVVCGGLAACGGSDDDEGGQGEPMRKAQVSQIDTLMRQQPLNNFIFKRMSSTRERITLATDPTKLSNHPDYYSLWLYVDDTPIAKKASGRYEARDVEAVVYSYTGYGWSVKKKLSVPSSSASAWVDLQYQNKTSDGEPLYTVTFHADSLKESNGGYAKDITISGTGYFGTMLEY
jgi:hypothetical protein